MKRRAAFGLAALLAAAVLSGCSSTQRPEGIVDRWLLAVNEGAAGRPEQFAPDSLSERMLPGWRTKDPGQLDTIEVGRGAACVSFGLAPLRTACYRVPIRVVDTDGTTRQQTATLISVAGGDWHVRGLQRGTSDLLLPSQGGPTVGSSSLGLWLISLGVAIALTLISMLLMHLVGRRPLPLSSTTAASEGDATDRKT